MTDSSTYVYPWTHVHKINYHTDTYFIPQMTRNSQTVQKFTCLFKQILLLGYLIQHNKESKWIVKLKSKMIFVNSKAIVLSAKLLYSGISCHLVWMKCTSTCWYTCCLHHQGKKWSFTNHIKWSVFSTKPCQWHGKEFSKYARLFTSFSCTGQVYLAQTNQNPKIQTTFLHTPGKCLADDIIRGAKHHAWPKWKGLWHIC
jgi:hypothetical protein